MVEDESIFDASPSLKKFKDEYLSMDTKGIVDDTIENSAYIYKLLKNQDVDERLEYLHHLKSHYEGNFACLMKELIHRDSMLSNEDNIAALKKRLDNGEISLDEYKKGLKDLIKH